MSQVDEDFKIVVQFLTDVPPQFGGGNRVGIRVIAGDPEIHLMFGKEAADFCFVDWGLPLIGFPLEKARKPDGLVPQRIVSWACRRCSENMQRWASGRGP